MKARADTSKRFPPKNAAGNPQCRECGKERPRGVAWRSWCSDVCVESYKVRAWPAHAAKAATKRDNGVCAQCGADTVRLKAWLRTLPSTWERERRVMSLPSWSACNQYGREDRFSKANGVAGKTLGRHQSRAYTLLGRLWGVALHAASHLFEVDHIVPVAEGGGGCGLDNLRTLCRRCHRIESAALNNRLRKRPSKGVGRGFS